MHDEIYLYVLYGYSSVYFSVYRQKQSHKTPFLYIFMVSLVRRWLFSLSSCCMRRRESEIVFRQVRIASASDLVFRKKRISESDFCTQDFFLSFSLFISMLIETLL